MIAEDVAQTVLALTLTSLSRLWENAAATRAGRDAASVTLGRATYLDSLLLISDSVTVQVAEGSGGFTGSASCGGGLGGLLPSLSAG